MDQLVDTGDVFTIPLAPKSFGVGQVVETLPSELYVVVYGEIAASVEELAELTFLDRKPVFAAITLDALFYHRRWIVFANRTSNLARIAKPLTKVRINGTSYVENLYGTVVRRASKLDTEVLPYRRTVAPIRVQKASAAHFGFAPTSPIYDAISYEAVERANRPAMTEHPIKRLLERFGYRRGSRKGE